MKRQSRRFLDYYVHKIVTYLYTYTADRLKNTWIAFAWSSRNLTGPSYLHTSKMVRAIGPFRDMQDRSLPSLWRSLILRILAFFLVAPSIIPLE